MKDWKPRRVTFDMTQASLSRDESFLLSRINGRLSVDDLIHLTGLPPTQIHSVLDKLVEQGAIADDAPRFEQVEMVSAPDIDIASKPLLPPEDDPTAEHPTLETANAAAALATAEAAEQAALDEALAPEPVEHEPEEHNYRKIYETQLHPLSADERARIARIVTEDPTLKALCFDQDPTVIQALLQNERVGLEHARIVAFHHRSAIGLQKLAARTEFMNDTQVQRRLLRNVQLPEMLLTRVLKPKRMIEIYKTSLDRDVPDRLRGTARTLLRGRFATAQPEERFELVWNTEGRVLASLIGCTIDSRTTAMFQSRQVASIMLIQAFCRWPATPPGILAHFLKQPLVKRQVHLRRMILQHPNCPSERKR
jgi:hypothetical protein